MNNKKILLADDELTLSCIKQGVSNIEKYLKENGTSVSETAVFLKLRMDLLYMVKSFSHTVKSSNVAGLNSVSRALKNHGFEVVKVPGRLYDIDSMMCSGSTLNHFFNYMNGVVHENPDGSLVYITNKSKLNKQFNITPEISEKIGFDFEKMFLDKISPYIKKENVYFIDNVADDLHNLHGGIHCLCNEIPKDIPNTFNSNSIDNYVPVKIGLINRIINYLIDLLN